MKSKTKALEQLEICEKGKTDFDEQFLIFRYKYIYSIYINFFIKWEYFIGKLLTKI